MSTVLFPRLQYLSLELFRLEDLIAQDTGLLERGMFNHERREVEDSGKKEGSKHI